MAKSFYAYIADAWKTYRDADHLAIRQKRLYDWRREPVITRVERPARLDRARALGYKAKQGYIVVRTRVRRGSLRKTRFKMGAKPSGMGVEKHHLPVDPAHRRRARLQEIPEHGGPQLLLGRRTRRPTNY